VQHDPGRTFSQVVATPLAHLDRSREVLLVWPGETTTILEGADLAPLETPADTVTEDSGAAGAAMETDEVPP
jgi:rod shape-determining protein MreC